MVDQQSEAAASGADTGPAASPIAPLAAVRDGSPGWHRAVMLAIVVVFGGVYLATLHPGVDHNDRAEMQHVIPLLGVAHPPGYPIMMTVGKLFSMLPIGPDEAYRLNLLQALAATLTLILLYAALRRITGQMLPGLVAAGVLGWSSIYWQNALVAEVYVFYLLFLVAAVYCATRYFADGRARWLYLLALCLGISMWNRTSELFVLPAFLLLWLVSLRTFRITPRRFALATLCFLLPLAYSLAYFELRFDPGQPYVRDDVLRDQIREEVVPRTLTSDVRYVLGLKWQGYSDRRRADDRFATDRAKLWWLLSGADTVRDDNPYAEHPGTTGVAVGLPALILAGLGIVFYVRRPAWWLLGVGLVAGNVAFYFYHIPSNNLDFISPAILGLALLAGLGTAGWGVAGGPRGWGLRGWQLLCCAVPVWLLVSNYGDVNRNTPAEHARQRHLAALADAPLPQEAVILASRKSAMVYRYLFHVRAGRTDVAIINENRVQNWPALLRAYREAGRPVFVRARLWQDEQTAGVEMPGERLQGGLRRAVVEDPALTPLGFYRFR